MAISDEDISRVREASDIVSIFSERVPLKQKGRDFWCCCPFHNEKTPSCKIDPVTQLWHCFGCGEGGDVFKFIMKSDDISFPDAVRTLAQRANIDIAETGRGGIPNSRKARLREVCEETASFYHLQLTRSKSDDAARARTYLGGRELGGSIPKEWNLGFAPGHGQLVRHLRSKGFTYQDMIEANVATGSGNQVRDRFFNRVMFPICDVQGSCIAFGGRVIGEGEPKYLNSQETPIFHKSNVLYGLHKAKDAMVNTGVAIIVEGYTDVIALHRSGVKNAVATLGTALTKQHIRLISRYAQKRIVYLFDGDAAGQRAADRALEFIDDTMTPEAGSMRTELYAVTLPDDLDPADFVSKHGGEALNSCIEEAQPLLSYGLNRRLARYDLSSAEGRSFALAESLKVLAPIKESLLAKDYAVQLAGKLQLREQDVLDELARVRPPRRYRNDDDRPNGVSPDAGNAPYEKTGSSPSASLSQIEVNRRRVERELLSLCSQYPSIALAHVDALAQTNWHERLHADLAAVILDRLSANAACSPAEIVAAASNALPRAAGILTSAQANDDVHAEKLIRYLSEELAIGDMEATIQALKSSLDQTKATDSNEYDLLFQSVVELQRDVRSKKAAHKPIM